MSDKSHPSFDVSVVAPALESLHEQVTRTKGRIEITRRGTDDRCVLISKEELDCLERAIELLSETDSYRDLAGQIAAVAEDCVQVS
jgi:PHD/YefM family antitoxin component YafN of YafNO toxin-antitoxin module